MCLSISNLGTTIIGSTGFLLGLTLLQGVLMDDLEVVFLLLSFQLLLFIVLSLDFLHGRYVPGSFRQRCHHINFALIVCINGIINLYRNENSDSPPLWGLMNFEPWFVNWKIDKILPWYARPSNLWWSLVNFLTCDSKFDIFTNCWNFAAASIQAPWEFAMLDYLTTLFHKHICYFTLFLFHYHFSFLFLIITFVWFISTFNYNYVQFERPI